MFYYIITITCMFMLIAAWKFIGMQTRDLKVALLTLLIAFACASGYVNYQFATGEYKAVTKQKQFADVMPARLPNADDVFSER